WGTRSSWQNINRRRASSARRTWSERSTRRPSRCSPAACSSARRNEMDEQKTKPPAEDYFVGVGLCKAGGPAALAVVSRVPPTEKEQAKYTVRHVECWKAGTKYRQVADDTHALVGRLKRPDTRLVVDAGVSGPVVDLFRGKHDKAWMSPL